MRRALQKSSPKPEVLATQVTLSSDFSLSFLASRPASRFSLCLSSKAFNNRDKSGLNIFVHELEDIFPKSFSCGSVLLSWIFILSKVRIKHCQSSNEEASVSSGCVDACSPPQTICSSSPYTNILNVEFIPEPMDSSSVRMESSSVTSAVASTNAAGVGRAVALLDSSAAPTWEKCSSMWDMAKQMTSATLYILASRNISRGLSLTAVFIKATHLFFNPTT
mmetsp:Transcript_24484/g.56817  ORF Transcript_24484/g.56817 Transcript_24484/m.56817 type:complete len:221 (+) Transcript_24484:210-872(+)